MNGCLSYLALKRCALLLPGWSLLAVRRSRQRNLLSGKTSWTIVSVGTMHMALRKPPVTTLLYQPESVSDGEQLASVPIGQPIANTQAYVLDTLLQPVPAGVPGELFISGVGLARGYLHRPDLTAERFLPHPFSTIPGARLYRTGDMVRYQPNGNLEFIGRADTQVKLRGFRVEPGEIETLLSQHTAVSDVVVLAREDTPNDIRLVAYIVTKQNSPSLVAQLRKHLQDKLPPYMIPAAFVLMETLPRVPSGKVNRRALPAPERMHTNVDEAYEVPRTPIEEILAGMWASVLHLELVSRNDHFFKLGGHSLQATQVVARLREVLQVEMPVRAIYDAPTLPALAMAVERARQREKGQLIPHIQRADRRSVLPLSFAQQRLWFLDQLQSGSPFYNMPIAFYVRGLLDVATLEQSLNALVLRHEILRTTFAMVNEQPVQIIAPTLHLPLHLVRLAEIADSSAQKAEVVRLAREEAQRPFDLQHGPLIRATLLCLSSREHALLLTLHHIIADGWSADIFFQELNTLYTARTTGQPFSLPDLSVQYADYAIWQREWLQGELLEKQLAYWRQQLHDAPVKLELPTDHPRPAIQTFKGAHLAFTLPLSLSQQLQSLSREEGVTLFMTLLAAFQVLLSRYAGQTDVVVGTPISGRTHRETEGLIGLFLNTLVMRTDLSGDISFRELLGRVREVSLGAYMHQDLPFEKLVEELQPERSLSQSPLFQVLFVLQNVPPSRIKLSSLSLEPLDISSETAKFDISFELVETSRGLAGSVEYNTDVFEAATIKRMIGHYVTILEGIVTNSEQCITTLPLLTTVESQQVLKAWNDTHRVYSQNQYLHSLFEVQAELTPDRVAVVFEEQQWTYRELNERANQLAHYLQQLGVGPEVVVGLCLERSLEMVVGLIAILKAGGVYMPLDPEYPRERLIFMLHDAQTSVLLTRQQYREIFLEYQETIVYLDSQWNRLATESTTNPFSGVTSENLAYMIYTSGSTGKPKGAMNTHRGISNRLLWMLETYHLAETDRVLQKTPFSFDVSVWEFFWPLLNGAQLIMVRPKGHRDSAYLVKLLIEQKITALHFVPSMLYAFLEEPGLEQCQSLRQVICSGEALTLDLQERFFARLNAELHNLYGPTEAAIEVTFWACRRESDRQIVPIGHPIANTQIYLLDTHLQPVPISVPGELYIGGVGLARGYHNRPDLTAEMFIPDPFSDKPGQRLYKTGDLARLLADGAIEFLGRINSQTKLRGFRIELQEVETVLAEYPGIRETVALVREDVPGDQRLVAYIVARQEYTPEELRSFLRERLPEYMIPSVFIPLQQLPLTTSGKIDRHILPIPEYKGYEMDVSTSPQTVLEEVLTGIWVDILHLERVGVRDNFFDLGGHSLLATRMIARVREIFQVDVPLRAIFESPTVVDLAGWIEVARNGSSRISDVPSLVSQAREMILPLSFEQERLWFLSQLEPDSPAYNIPVALQVQGDLNLDVLGESLNVLVQRHEALRTTFMALDGIPRQVIAPDLYIKPSIINLNDYSHREQEHEVRRWATEEASEPFDLSRGPLLRVKILQLDVSEHILLITIHHSIADAWSIGILLNELSTIYSAIITRSTLCLINAAHPIRGLCSLAAKMATRRSIGTTGGLLAQAIAECFGCAGYAH